MARWYKCFKTADERKAWEKDKASENPRFHVCMRMTAQQIEKDMFMPKGSLSEFKYATVYTFRD